MSSKIEKQAQFLNEISSWMQDTFTPIDESPEFQRNCLNAINSVLFMENLILDAEVVKHILNKMLELTFILKDHKTEYDDFINLNQ